MGDDTEGTEKKGGFFRKLMKLAFIASDHRGGRPVHEAAPGRGPRRRRMAGAAAAGRRVTEQRAFRRARRPAGLSGAGVRLRDERGRHRR